MRLRRAGDRGHFDHGWLQTYHTFSFAEFHDPDYMGFRSLRVINEDQILPGQGFGTHSHRDMEIVTYVLSGALEHKDSLGNTSVIKPGEVQRMTAGSGVTHSEFNHSKSDTVHLLQIWIHPNKKNLKPGYEQRLFDPKSKINKLRLIASPDGHEKSVKVHQDVLIFGGHLQDRQMLTYQPEGGRGVWVQMTRGELELGGKSMSSGDGAAIESAAEIKMISETQGEFLLFDLA